MNMPSKSQETKPCAGAHSGWNLALSNVNVFDAERTLIGLDLLVYAPDSLLAVNRK